MLKRKQIKITHHFNQDGLQHQRRDVSEEYGQLSNIDRGILSELLLVIRCGPKLQANVSDLEVITA